ncbi:phospholipase D [Aidingimonas halophila]|nr:phospholipase D [Aidingimonas halophila]
MWWGLLLAVLVGCLAMAMYQTRKPLPPGVGEAGPLRDSASVAFLYDETFRDPDGHAATDQSIFDDILTLIGQAERLLVIDMFLFNDFAGSAQGDYRPLSSQLTQALIERKQSVPELDIVVITDPINTLYGSLEPDHFRDLREAGVVLVTTDLHRLRASNPTWSGFWHLCCAWLGNDTGGGWLPNLLGPGKVTLRGYLDMLNFRANHRKTLVADHGDSWVGLVTSMNPHDASSRHTNTALRFSGAAALDLLNTEWRVAHWSGGDIGDRPAERVMAATTESAGSSARLQILTEGRIRDALLASVDGTVDGDRLDIAVFYLSHRPMVAALKRARQRGVTIRLLLDPNRDAFGLEKNGIPNRQVAHELHRAGVEIRWCATNGEQCHPKMLLKTPAEGPSELIIGSANFTRRNLDNLNLETSVRLLADAEQSAMADAVAFFERHWHNRHDRRYSVGYERFADDSRVRYWQYRLMESTGLSTF